MAKYDRMECCIVYFFIRHFLFRILHACIGQAKRNASTKMKKHMRVTRFEIDKSYFLKILLCLNTWLISITSKFYVMNLNITKTKIFRKQLVEICLFLVSMMSLHQHTSFNYQSFRFVNIILLLFLNGSYFFGGRSQNNTIDEYIS